MPQARWDPGAVLGLFGVVAGLALLMLGSLASLRPTTAQPQGTLRLQGRTIASSPGGVVTYTLTVSNSTAARRTLDLAVSGQRWPLTYPASVTVGANALVTVPVAVRVPFALAGAGQDSATLTLTPDGGGNPLTARLGSSTAGQASASGYTGCRFDLDRNGVIAALDAAAIAARFGVAGSDAAFDRMVDLDHDGRIGAADIQAVAGRAGTTCAGLPATDTAALREAVTLESVNRHLEALQEIATANGGNRAALRPGFDASVAYVRSQLETAGYTVTVQTFTIPVYEQIEPSRLVRIAPAPKVYTPTVEFSTFTNSASGSVTATLQAVDLVIPPGATMNTSTSGCETSDFADFTAGNIALIQRGTCTFQQKVENAQGAGAVGVLIFNEGQQGRAGVIASSLNTQGVTVPVFGTSYALGAELAGLITGTPSGVTMHMFAHVGIVDRPTYNVLADTPAGDDGRTIVVGGHLDSVTAGPGINDNGSGTATILETAIQMARLEIAPRNTVRFAFWGGEERGLLGSSFYVDQLDIEARDRIWMNLNFDMLGSPNFARQIYDGDGSSTPLAGPTGSDEIEAVFERHFGAQNLASEPTAFSGRSDYGPFIAVGIPAGGLFTGAEVRKSAAQAARYGGTAGEPLDPCYHQVCDTITNIHPGVLAEMGDAVADIVMGYAMDDRTVLDRPGGITLDGSVDSHYDLEFKGSGAPRR
jgi:Zn-dependent M28 family amino/carboxypeptidase